MTKSECTVHALMRIALITGEAMDCQRILDRPDKHSDLERALAARRQQALNNEALPLITEYIARGVGHLDIRSQSKA